MSRSAFDDGSLKHADVDYFSYKELCQNSNLSYEGPDKSPWLYKNTLFHSPAWQNVLHSAFNSKPIYARIFKSNTFFTITNFPAGPFHIGYIGFPAGSAIMNRAITSDVVDAIAKGPPPCRLDVLRLTSSAFDRHPQPGLEEIPGKTSSLPETAVVNLQDWDPQSLPSTVRRNIKKAVRSELKIVEADNDIDANEIYDLYRRIVTKHSGRLRYNKVYFANLLTLSVTNADLRFFIAKKGRELAAFLVTANEGDITYYLHGATNAKLQQFRPSDLLFKHAICEAKEHGSNTFNMMASPNHQRSLVRFKEKWGGTTREMLCFDVALNRIAAAAFGAISQSLDLIQTFTRR